MPTTHSTPAEPCHLQAILREHIQSADAWIVVAGPCGLTYNPVVLNGMSSPDLANLHYSEEQLGELDQRLPEVMCALANSTAPVVGANVRATLMLWRDELIQLPAGMFNDNSVYHALASSFTAQVLAVKTDLGDPQPVVLTRFLGFEVACTAQGTQYVQRCAQPNFSLRTTWLDENHPHWRDTAILAGVLGMTPAQFAQMLLFAPGDQQAGASVLPSLNLS